MENNKDYNRRSGFRRYLTDPNEAGYNISWGAILAGVVTFLALLITFSLIGSAIGFGQVEATTNHPLDGVGTGLLIWTIVSFILSLAGAGFISGLTARRVGVVHGFLTWASGLLVLVFMLSMLTTSVFSAVGSTLGGVFSIAGQGVETIASGTGNVLSDSFDLIVDEVSEVDTQEVTEQTNQILRDTEVEELQPEYINNQLKQATAEITNAGKEIALNPDNSEQIIDETVNSLQKRIETIIEATNDKEAITNAITNNSDLTEQEAAEVTDNIYDGLQTASKEAEQKLNQASVQIEQMQADIEQTIEEARVKADEAADATAKASLWGFVALFLAMLLTSFAGLAGSNFVVDKNEERM